MGALDERLGGWISLAVKRGMVGGHLGEVFLVPARGRLGADAVVTSALGVARTRRDLEAALRRLASPRRRRWGPCWK